MKYVLDTNTVSALIKGDRRVVERLRRVPKTDVCIPQPVIAEIVYGLERLPRSRRRDSLQQRFDLVRSEIQRMDWSDDVSLAFGFIKATLERKGRRIEDFDAAIAAHALAHDAILVTSNVDHMIRVPKLAIEDWSNP